ncbi:MAG: hypothetical protein PF447_03275 [Spirochaetaceae bacterium]|jgi:hypothetical protein|nr:hypothetical protein [Spirochaetaceae bacterium]
MKGTMLIVILSLLFTGLWADELILLNRTGFNIMELQYLDEQTGLWSGNLIPYDVIMSQDYWQGDVSSQGTITLRLTDEFGDVYTKDVSPWQGQNKQLITIQDLLLMQSSEDSLTIRLVNQIDWPVTKLYISPQDRDDWGEELLKGKILRQGEQIELKLPGVSEGFYDLLISCYEADTLLEYRLNDFELRDRGLFYLNAE